jgi:hypothetical protein
MTSDTPSRPAKGRDATTETSRVPDPAPTPAPAPKPAPVPTPADRLRLLAESLTAHGFDADVHVDDQNEPALVAVTNRAIRTYAEIDVCDGFLEVRSWSGPVRSPDTRTFTEQIIGLLSPASA